METSTQVLLAAAVLAATLAGAAPRAQSPAAALPPGPQTSAPVPVSCPELATALRAVSANDIRLRDWPNLARYRDPNRTVSAVRVVFMGDSITDSWQQSRFGGFFAGRPYVDRGISGQTTPQMLLRFRADVIDLGPQAVVILGGTNDIAGNTGPESDEEIEGYLSSMSELAHAHGIAVVLASLTPVSAYHTASPTAIPQTTQRPMTRIQALNAWLAAYAASHGDVYLDYFSAMVDSTGLMREDLTSDDLHPNAKGYAIMAPLAEAAIARAIK